MLMPYMITVIILNPWLKGRARERWIQRPGLNGTPVDMQGDPWGVVLRGES